MKHRKNVEKHCYESFFLRFYKNKMIVELQENVLVDVYSQNKQCKAKYQCICASVVLRESNTINTFLLLVNVDIRSKAITYFVFHPS